MSILVLLLLFFIGYLCLDKFDVSYVQVGETTKNIGEFKVSLKEKTVITTSDTYQILDYEIIDNQKKRTLDDKLLYSYIKMNTSNGSYNVKMFILHKIYLDMKFSKRFD